MNAELSPSCLTFSLPIDEMMRPVPEVVLLLDQDGCILRASARHAGPRLGGLDFPVGKKIHGALHKRCKDERCPFTARWNRAWEEHRAGLPIEWITSLEQPEGVYKIRLQSVDYACGQLFEDSVSQFAGCSVAFVQDVTEHYTPRRTARMRRATDQLIGQALQAECRFSERPCDLVSTFDERLNATTGRLLLAQESERKRIAAELHDSLGQTLSLLNFEIDALKENCADQDASRSLLQAERIANYVQRSLGELRHIVQGLRPAVFSDMGLYGALETLCADFRAACPATGLDFEFVGEQQLVPNDVAVAVYRIAQEALNNISRHADASVASLSLKADQDAIVLAISDDGIGLDHTATTGEGIGLKTMGERTRILGGQFTVDTATGCGCRIRAQWPGQSV